MDSKNNIKILNFFMVYLLSMLKSKDQAIQNKVIKLKHKGLNTYLISICDNVVLHVHNDKQLNGTSSFCECLFL